MKATGGAVMVAVGCCLLAVETFTWRPSLILVALGVLLLVLGMVACDEASDPNEKGW